MIDTIREAWQKFQEDERQAQQEYVLFVHPDVYAATHEALAERFPGLEVAASPLLPGEHDAILARKAATLPVTLPDGVAVFPVASAL